MRWVYDSAGRLRHSRYRGGPYCLPRQATRSAPGLGDFGAHLPCLHAPCLRFAAHLTMGRRKTRGHSWSLAITM